MVDGVVGEGWRLGWRGKLVELRGLREGLGEGLGVVEAGTWLVAMHLMHLEVLEVLHFLFLLLLVVLLLKQVHFVLLLLVELFLELDLLLLLLLLLLLELECVRLINGIKRACHRRRRRDTHTGRRHLLLRLTTPHLLAYILLLPLSRLHTHRGGTMLHLVLHRLGRRRLHRPVPAASNSAVLPPQLLGAMRFLGATCVLSAPQLADGAFLAIAAPRVAGLVAGDAALPHEAASAVLEGANEGLVAAVFAAVRLEVEALAEEFPAAAVGAGVSGFAWRAGGAESVGREGPSDGPRVRLLDGGARVHGERGRREKKVWARGRRGREERGREGGGVGRQRSWTVV